MSAFPRSRCVWKLATSGNRRAGLAYGTPKAHWHKPPPPEGVRAARQRPRPAVAPDGRRRPLALMVGASATKILRVLAQEAGEQAALSGRGLRVEEVEGNVNEDGRDRRLPLGARVAPRVAPRELRGADGRRAPAIRPHDAREGLAGRRSDGEVELAHADPPQQLRPELAPGGVVVGVAQRVVLLDAQFEFPAPAALTELLRYGGLAVVA